MIAKKGYGFKIRKYQMSNGSILFGGSFNTNDKYSVKREFYLDLYLLKYQIVIGWFR